MVITRPAFGFACPAGCPHPLIEHSTFGCDTCDCRYGRPRFPLGGLCATPAAVIALAHHSTEIASLIARHASGDWGDIDQHLAELNDQALNFGGLLHSIHRLDPDSELWIITEADRATTTLLLPSDY
jgi:hypothetical protein